ncbi:hypothetical protein F0L17_26640 [Streptomyces sp. TRM43335]|uniref:Uncharacterized protein n=1 Tax=Streptomyces taklimakanensis TaxID=2569853 RepID=A0A6G2BKK6_9ACTN|nr:hypothetical protein [Streptomyces taklimakanensis]MTE22609.1 hypothetical protein [Streptomyces taklimakanensis]
MPRTKRRLPAPRRTPHVMTPGQLGIGSEEPWQPTGCACWPPDPRTGCQHCRVCDTCQDCRQCAGRGCVCACGEED